MTHTFKLARRMARFRLIAASSALLVAGACGGDDLTTTGPSAPEKLPDPATNDSLPSTDQLPPPSPSPSPTLAPVGIPFGPFSLWSTSHLRPVVDPAPFTASTNFTDASGIVTQINAARALGHKLMLAMTGGAHSNYITNGRFDLAKWKATMNTFNTPAIKAAVAAGVADGTIIGNSVMDEPEHGSWGGVMTKPLVDQMGAYVKATFPTLPVGVVHGPNGYYPDSQHSWRPTERYRVLDYVLTQYNWWITTGNIATWRDKVLAQAALDGVAMAFSLNLLDGGIHNSTTRTCPIPLTGGTGTYSYACRMTAAQVRDWGLALGPSGCALLMWRHDATFVSKPDNMQAFNDVAARLATSPAKSCRRT